LIAVNVMSLDVAAISQGEEGLKGLEELGAKGWVEIPVLDNEGRIKGVVREKDLAGFVERGDMKWLEGAMEREDLLRGDFIATLPGATVDELGEMLAGCSRADGREVFIYIVDRQGRLLGRVGAVEMSRRKFEYAAHEEGRR